MHTITIAFRHIPTTWRLVFKTEETAKKAWDSTTQETFVITDDYGQVCEGRSSDIAGKLMEDVTKSNLAAVELTINAHHIQAQVQKRVETDPLLRMSRGPAVLSPMQMPFNGRG